MRVLVIGTVRPAHQALVDLGHEVSVMLEKDAAKPVDLKFPYRHMVLLAKDAGPETYARIAAELHAEEPFGTVISFNDATQEIGLAVAERLGIGFQVSAQTLRTLYNKDATRRALHEAGLDDTRYASVDSEEALRAFVAELDGPAIVKPLAATASSGVTKVEGFAGVEHAIARLKSAGHAFPVLVEEFLGGEEYSVEAFSENGEHCILAITQKYKDPTTFVELGHVCPAPLSEEQAAQIQAFIPKALDAIGLRDGASHTELMLTPRGPRLIESHSRVGGDRIFKLVELATGVGLFEMECRQRCGEAVLPLIADRRRAHDEGERCVVAIRFAALGIDERATLRSVEGLEAARLIEGIHEVELLKQPGDRLPPVASSFQRTAFAVATATDADTAVAACEKALETLVMNVSWQHA